MKEVHNQDTNLVDKVHAAFVACIVRSIRRRSRIHSDDLSCLLFAT